MTSENVSDEASGAKTRFSRFVDPILSTDEADVKFEVMTVVLINVPKRSYLSHRLQSFFLTYFVQLILLFHDVPRLFETVFVTVLIGVFLLDFRQNVPICECRRASRS